MNHPQTPRRPVSQSPGWAARIKPAPEPAGWGNPAGPGRIHALTWNEDVSEYLKAMRGRRR